MTPPRTAIVADLHLGTAASALNDEDARRRLLAGLHDVERIVLLGDVLDLRHGRAADVVAHARPFLDELLALGEDTLLVPGNHDHRLATPVVDAGRALGLEQRSDGGPLLPDIPVAYPGVWIRPDVYATHGHYLDCHLHVPRPEAILAHLTQLGVGRIPGRATPRHYEGALAPIYAAAYRAAQRGRRIRETRWRRLAVRDWIGREGVRAMNEVVRRLGIDAEHVIFGHTHRPLVEGRLVNAGSWVAAGHDAYRPGAIVVVGVSGPPELRYVLSSR